MALFKVFLFVILVIATAAANNCAKPCPRDYKPICGFDGHKEITYDNKCLFEIANCESNYKLRLIRNGECIHKEEKLTDESKCLRPCPLINLPVCGFDGDIYQTFANKCEYDVMNCIFKNKLRFIKMGVC